ncbi:unnamed protein product [Lampetra planeri]
MLTRRKTLTVVSLDEEDGGEVILQIALGPGTPENHPEEALPAEQREKNCDSTLRPLGGGRRIRNTHLADLLSAAAALVAEMDMEELKEDVVMAAIFDPPSNVRQKFAKRRRGEIETPLTFRSALMSLAQAAIPKMEHAGLDSLVLERLLEVGSEN